MKTIKAQITKIKHKGKFLFRFVNRNRDLYAYSPVEDWDLDQILTTESLIFKLADHYYILGYSGREIMNSTEYNLGAKLILREYTNGNLAIFMQGLLNSTASVFSYDNDKQFLCFDKSILEINTKSLPPRYLVENKYDSLVEVRRLLTSPEFQLLSGIPRETLRNWTLIGKFVPAKIHSCHAFYTAEQIEQAKEVHKILSNSAEIKGIILNEIKLLDDDMIVHLNFFKKLVPDYNRRRYSTLKMIIQQLLAEKIIRRVSCGYYKKNNQTG